MFVITGGAGFIGSNVAASLDASGKDVVIVDWLGSNDFKWRNIAKRRLFDVVTPENCFAFVEANRSSIEGIVHMGAISTTTETNVDVIIRNNLRLSIDLWNICARHAIPLVYASSAATYGNGERGFCDRFDDAYLTTLRPLNPYGWSKHAFDRFVLQTLQRKDARPPHWVGLKFFNVYGPNEYHKGGQRSVAIQLHEQIRDNGHVRLFRSENPEYSDGGQLRDFVWVGDCVDVIVWALDAKASTSGLYNVGSGIARSFIEKAEIMFREMQLTPCVEFVDLPQNLIGKYQYYTCASLEKLRLAGYRQSMTGLEDGLRRYVCDFLEGADRFC